MLCLTETWLNPDEYITLKESPPPHDYCYKHVSRPKTKGGGDATIYSNIFSISQKSGFFSFLISVLIIKRMYWDHHS